MEKTFNYENLNPECELNRIRESRQLLLVEADHLVNVALDNGVDIAPYRQYRHKNTSAHGQTRSK